MHYEQFADGTVKCIEDEIPFDIPKGWAWCRLEACCTKEIKRGKTPKYVEKSNHLVFAQKCNTKAGYINLSLAQHLDETTLKKYSDADFMQFGDIVINSTGTGTLGRVGIYEQKDNTTLMKVVPDSHITTVRVFDFLNAKYIYMFLKNFQGYLENSGEGSTNQKELRTAIISNIIVPLPPLREQIKISELYFSSLNLISEIDIYSRSVENLIEIAKSKILDLAIRGKLVPQDENDEPASVLLERIKAEKEEQIKSGKIKRDKKESVIFKGEDNSYYEKIGSDIKNIDDEILFDLPQNWAWTRITNIADIIMGSSPKGTSIKNSGDGMEFHQGKLAFTNKIIAHSGNVTTSPTKIAPLNSVLLCVRAPVGEVNITDRKICVGRGLAAVTPIGEISVDFMFYWLQAHKDFLNSKATGSTFVAVTADTVKRILIPFPPLAEQNKIIDTIQKLNVELGNISSQLS